MANTDYCVACQSAPCRCRLRRPSTIIPVASLEELREFGKIHSDGSSSDYYQLPPGAIEIQDLVEFKNMNFAVANIFKAAYRLGQKAGNDDLYDIRKILWYANREKARLEKLQQEKA